MSSSMPHLGVPDIRATIQPLNHTCRSYSAALAGRHGDHDAVAMASGKKWAGRHGHHGVTMSRDYTVEQSYWLGRRQSLSTRSNSRPVCLLQAVGLSVLLFGNLMQMCTARWPLRHAALSCKLLITDYQKNETYHWWNVFDDMCRMAQWSFWSSFDVIQSTFDEDMREKRLFHFRSQWPWHLTFKPQICFPSYLVQGHVCTKLEVSSGFPVSRKSEACTDRRTDGRTECNTKCDSLGWAA